MAPACRGKDHRFAEHAAAGDAGAAHVVFLGQVRREAPYSLGRDPAPRTHAAEPPPMTKKVIVEVIPYPRAAIPRPSRRDADDRKLANIQEKPCSTTPAMKATRGQFIGVEE